MEERQHECKRCGRCCMTVGRTYWKHGNLDADRPFGDLKLLNHLANDDIQDDEGICEMLFMIDGDWSCAIETFLGREYKPAICKAWPEDRELCFREKVEQQQGCANVYNN